MTKKTDREQLEELMSTTPTDLTGYVENPLPVVLMSDNFEKQIEHYKSTTPVKEYNSNRIYTDEVIIDELLCIYKFLEQNKDVVFFGEYWDDLYTQKRIPRKSLEKCFQNYKLPAVAYSIKDAISDLVETRLINGGLKNKLNGYMTTFLLKNNHGYTDKVDQNVTVTNTDVVFEFGKNVINLPQSDYKVIEEDEQDD